VRVTAARRRGEAGAAEGLSGTRASIEAESGLVESRPRSFL